MKCKRTGFVLAIFLFIGVRVVFGVPVFGKRFNLLQPDGSTVAVKIWGDEFYQVVESLDGFTLIRDPETNRIEYAVLSGDGSELLPTGISAGEPLDSKTLIPKHLRITKESSRAKVEKARERFAKGEDEILQLSPGDAPLAAPNNGNVMGICLIVDFPDEAGTIPSGNVDDFCNMAGYVGYGNNGSVRDYFYDVSDGNLTYTNYVTPTYYTAQYNKSYYDNPAEETGPKARELIIEALNDLESSGFDFSQYDSDSDGLIDGINCFYAGSVGSGWAKGLWPHSWTVSFSADGVSTYKYQITDMGSELEMGTFCHENGHMICLWPDLYDYGYESEGVGYYCLMAAGSFGGGGLNPHEPCAAFKIRAGWASVSDLSSPQTALTVSAGVNSFYKFAHPSSVDEFFLISNRQKTGRDSTLPDAGLAIWHVDENGSNDNEQMTCASHYLVTLVQADGDWDLENDVNRGDSTDLYDLASYSECSPVTLPNTDWWCDGASQMRIYDISSSADTMTFSFTTAGSPPQAFDSDTITIKNSPVSVVLSAVDDGDPEPPGVLSYIITSLPANGSLDDPLGTSVDSVPYTLAANGAALIYTSDPNFVGADSFQFKANDSGFSPEGGDSNIATATVTVADAIYFANMDSDPGWSFDAGTGLSRWQWGSPSGGGGEYGFADPSLGHTDANVVGYNLSGDYFNDIDPPQWATTPPIDCTGYVNVTLSFYRWLNVEQPLYDNAYIEVSNNGVDWTQIWENATEITDSSWTLQTLDISSTADLGAAVYIRWGIASDSSWMYSGWNIDDVLISGDLAPSSPPQAFDGDVTMEINSPVDISLIAIDEGDPEPPAMLSYIITSLATNGALTDPNGNPINAVPYVLVGNGNDVTYTPDTGFIGSDSFGFKANDGGSPPDGGDSNVTTISIVVSQTIEVFSEDFETAPTAFTIDNNFGDGSGLWHLTEACESATGEHSTPASLYYGVDSQCNYDAGLTEGVATSPVIDLAGYVAPVSLEFDYYLVTENFYGYDIASVEVSVDGGAFVELASNTSGSLADPTSEWTSVLYDLSGMAGSEIQLRFRFRTVDGSYNGHGGFYVDDIKVIADLPAQPGDVNGDHKVNVADFAILALHWMETGCVSPGRCDGCDLVKDTVVNIDDLRIIVQNWLEGVG